jgi:predicted nucleotidyltransferase
MRGKLFRAVTEHGRAHLWPSRTSNRLRKVAIVNDLPPAARAALDEIVGRDDPGILGVVLSGSAARGMATERSDVDIYVVLTDEAAASRVTTHSVAVDEIPVTLTELEKPPPFGTDHWWYRWSFAWAQVLRDDTGGRIADAVRRQATLSSEEQEPLLVDRLDGYVNYVYRALKADRDGRPLERRLDSAESVWWLLDVVFTLARRVRPYNKYLPWELREHPLGPPEWSAAALLPIVERMLDGDAAALREGFSVVDREVRTYDAARGQTRCGDTVDAWGDELDLLRHT